MKALSLTQPWATLIAVGAKTIETRSWSTPYRGPLAIHASKAMPPDCRAFAYADPAGQVLNDAGILLGGDCAALPRGAIIATARLLDVVGTNDVMDDVMELACEHELAFGDYTPGRFAWILTDVVALPEPIPCKGALGLWTVPPETADAVRLSMESPGVTIRDKKSSSSSSSTFHVPPSATTPRGGD